MRMGKGYWVVAAALLAGASAAVPADAQPVQLKLGLWGPPSSYFYVDTIGPWAEKVNKDSQNTLDIKIFGGNVLGDQRRMYDSVMSNVAHIGWVTPSNVPGKFVKTTILELPFGFRTGEQGSIAYWRLYNKGLIAEEYAGTKVLGAGVFPPGMIMTRSKKVSTLEDLSGLKMRISGALQGETLKALGATPVSISVDQLYQSIDKGVIDGLTVSLTALRPFRLAEVVKYYVDVNLNGSSSALLINKETYDSLPAPARAAIDKHSGESLSRDLGASNDREVARAQQDIDKAVADRKAERVKLSPAEEKRWRERAETVVQEWVKATPDGAKVLAALRREVESLGGAGAK